MEISQNFVAFSEYMNLNVKILKTIFSNFVTFSDYLIFSKQTSQIVNYNSWILLGHCSKVFLSLCQFLEHFFIPNLGRYFIAKNVFSSLCSKLFSFQFLALVIGLELGDCFDYIFQKWQTMELPQKIIYYFNYNTFTIKIVVELWPVIRT